MARPLAVIAVGGLILSAVSFSLASALGDGEWAFLDFPFRHGLVIHGLFGRSCSEQGPPPTANSRELPWRGDGDVTIDVPASVHYRPGTGETVTLSGAPEALRHVRIDGGRIEFDCDWHGTGDNLEVTLPGRALRRFALNGSGQLYLDDVKQDELTIAINGSGGVRGNGEVDSLNLAIAGSGDADLGALNAKRLRAVIAGSGNARVAPEDDADIAIVGSGDVHLLTRPKNLSSRVVGSGRIIGTPSTPI
jgi:hypothetical protein